VSPDNLDYLHIGIGARRAGPDSDFFQLSGRPESNVADRYVDTGEFTGDFIAEVGVEILWDRGPFLIAAEHIEARAKSTETGDPRMTGDYLMASWVITGESRPYLRQIGTTGPITPTSRHGAFELVVRYSRLDLTDGVIDGGVLEKWHYGANWWLSPQWKAGVSYGDADLVRDNLDGNTKMLLFRLQWYY
jgi:phosphate-selective porin OprO/OprP